MDSDNKNVGRSKRISRREFLRLAALTTGSAALLTACGVAAPPPAEEKPAEAQAEQPAETQAEEPAESQAEAEPTEAPAAEQVTIAWWNQFNSPTTQEYFPKVVAEFEALNPNIKVEYEISGGPPGGGNFIEVLLARIAAGSPPDTTTLWSPPSQFGARGSLMAVDEQMATAQWAKPDAFYDGPLKSCQWDGKTYGLPASAGAGTIFINTAMFEEKGISTNREDFPTTWDGLKELSSQFTVWEGDELKQSGFVPWAESWLKPVWSGLNGGQLFDADQRQYRINTEQNIEWLEYWVNWLDEEYQGDIEQLNLYGNWSAGPYPEGPFQLGLAAMCLSGSWGCTDAEIPFDWEVVKLPAGPQGSTLVTGYWPNWWAIPNGVPHPAESFLLCEYFCTQGWVTWYKAVMDTPAWRDFPADVLTQKLVDAVGLERAQDVHNFFAAYLEDTVEMWNSPVEDFASDTMDSALDEVLHKTKTAAEALEEAQNVCQAELEKTMGG